MWSRVLQRLSQLSSEIWQSWLKQVAGYTLEIDSKRLRRAAHCLTKQMHCGDMLCYLLGAKEPWD